MAEVHWVVINITWQSDYSGRYKHRNPTFLKTKIFRPVNGGLPSPTHPHPVLPYVQTDRCGPGEQFWTWAALRYWLPGCRANFRVYFRRMWNWLQQNLGWSLGPMASFLPLFSSFVRRGGPRIRIHCAYPQVPHCFYKVSVRRLERQSSEWVCYATMRVWVQIPHKYYINSWVGSSNCMPVMSELWSEGTGLLGLTER